MPYRNRAVKRIKGQRAFKPHNPVVKFTWTKIYEVSSGNAQAGENAYNLQINASTPFNPISSTNGQWTPTETLLNEPLGLNSDMYRHYKSLVVKGCHVSASVVDNLDATNVSDDEKICLGQMTIIRATAPNTMSPTETAPELKQYYGQKSRDFTLASRTLAVDGLTKSAYCSNGYSAKKTWNSNPNAVDDLRVENQAGSSNTPSDSTYLNVVLVPRFQTNSFLQPMVCSVRITYIVQFQEPTIQQVTPLPINAEKILNKNKYKKIKTRNQYLNMRSKTLAQVAGATAYAMYKMGGYGRRRALMYR